MGTYQFWYFWLFSKKFVDFLKMFMGEHRNLHMKISSKIVNKRN